MDSDDDSFNQLDTSDEDIILDDETGASSQKVVEETYQYVVLTSDQIVQFMIDQIKEVNTVVQLPATTTRILLNHFRWDKEALMERYYGGDPEKLFKDAHVVSPSRATTSAAMASSSNSPKMRRARPSVGARVAAPTSTTGPAECEICFARVNESDMTGIECGHKFCRRCWTEYLTTKILDEGMGDTISCAAFGCDIIVDDQTVVKLVTDPRTRLKYQHIITNSFVLCNRILRWCPTPDCGHAIKVQYRAAQPVQCTCGNTFCFECGENWHDPVDCRYLKKWIKKCEDDSETSNWIAANTKECPKCQATIEKDGGCNHMVCKNQQCKADFCWICLGPWEPHGSSWYNCNRYDEDAAKNARDGQEKSRSQLQRYLFYCNRYMNHLQSLRFENKLYHEVAQKMAEFQQHNMSWIEVQFLKKAVDILVQCRTTLMYTYVFAFYLRKTNQSQIFEDNQKDLENATETLSEFLERDISQEMLVDIKQKVQDKSRYCEQRRNQLLDHVHEGVDRDSWEYTCLAT